MEEQWGKLSLSGEKDELINLGEDLSGDDKIKENQSLIGKVCVDQSIGKDIMKTTLGKIWRINKPAIIHKVGKYCFTITFDYESNKLRVLDGRPWLFDNYLFILRPLDGLLQSEAHIFNYQSFWIRMYKLPMMYMNRHYGILLGQTLREVEDVEVDLNDTS